MFALPNPPVAFSPLVVTVSFGLAAVVAFVVFRVAASQRWRSSPPSDQAESDARKCRYCRRGEALLREETVRLEGEELVGVRCYVCSNCGLPQWWVERRGIIPHVR
jgi:hypothetical protein